MLLASFGPEIIFAVGKGSAFTYKNVTSTKKAFYAKHYILDSTPQLEFTGYDVNSVTMECNFVNGWTVAPSVAILLLQTAFQSNTAYPLILGDSPLGMGLVSNFVIEELQEKYTRFDTSGSPIEASVSVKFLEAGQLLPSLGQLAGSVLNSITG